MTRLPSVTEVIGNIFPFDDTFFRKSLLPEGIEKKKLKWNLIEGGIADKQWYINYDDCMDTLCYLWSKVHAHFNMRALWLPIDIPDNFLKPYLQTMDIFIASHPLQDVHCELFTTYPEEYCGTMDVYCSIEGKKYIIDFKTWEIYKDFYGIKPEEKYKDKLKKVQLQMSMYARALRYSWQEVDWLMCVVIRADKFMVYPLDYDVSLYEQYLAEKAKSALTLK